jgi:hypothetical protein
VNLPLFSFAQSIGSLWQAVRQWLRQYTKPDTHSLILNAALDLTRPESQLDFLQTFYIFRAVFVFVIIELGSRRVLHFGVTRHPSDAWPAQRNEDVNRVESRCFIAR